MKPISSSDSKAQATLRLTFNARTVIRATRLALVVGPILVLINQGDTIAAGNSPDWLKVALTFAVPYCVSTWTSVAKDLESVFNHHSKNQRGN